MQIKQVMTKNVATCQPDVNLAEVVKLMWERDCGFVPVVDANTKVIGVITDRDICIASGTRGLAPEQILLSQAMRSDPIHATRPDETTDEALAMMRQFQVRRLPVIGADGTLKGIVSLNDIVLAAPQNDGPAPADIVSTLAAICARQPIGAVAARVYPTTRKRAVAPN